MSGFIFGVVVGAVINILTALFSRDKALKLLPWLLFYVLAHGTAVVLYSDSVWKSAMDQTARYGNHQLASYVVVMLVSVCLGGVYWKFVNVAVAKVEQYTKTPKEEKALSEQQKAALKNAKEITRKHELLERLRQEYILTHDNHTPALLAGTEPPPSEWINRRLHELGETWKVAGKPEVVASKPENTQQPDVELRFTGASHQR